jgi:hypothetical protein
MLQHDTYADRMNILSLIYSIPPPSHSPSAVYPPSTSTDSTQPSSPGSPSSESSGHLPPEPSPTPPDHVEPRRFSQETARYRGELFQGRSSPDGMSSSYTFSENEFPTFAVLQPNLQNTITPTLPQVYHNPWMMNQRPLYLGRLSTRIDQSHRLLHGRNLQAPHHL